MAQAAADPRRLLTGRSVIFLFLHGGPSQFETFDPKMSAPAEIRSTTGEISTAIPGVTFGSDVSEAGPDGRPAIDRPLVHHRKCQPRYQAGRQPPYGRGQPRLVFAASRGPPIPRRACRARRCCSPRGRYQTGPEQTQFGRFASTGSLGAGVPLSCLVPAATCNKICN